MKTINNLGFRWRFPSFKPRLLAELKTYNRGKFRADFASGLTVAIVALPLAMAFAIASGVPPQAGLFTAIIAGVLISALGGTRLCIGGPTGAYIVILSGIVAQYGIGNLGIATLMAGAILFCMGLVRLGEIIRLFPMPIITGFSNGIAVIIALTQIKDFFGLPLATLPSNFFALIPVLLQSLGQFHGPTLILASVSLALIFCWPASLKRLVPAPFVALFGSTLLVALFHLPVATIGSKFGGIPQGLPSLHLPIVDWGHFSDLLSPAFKIALLGAIESLLCAVVADKATGDRHDANQELMAQGIANLVCPLFGGIAATGAIARTATNIHNGGVSPFAGIIHALIILAVVLVAAPLASYIPLAGLAAILVSVGVKMGDWDIRKAKHYPLRDTFILSLTFALTVLFDLTIAIEIGLLLAAVFFIQRMAAQTQILAVSQQDAYLLERHDVSGKLIPPATRLYRIQGALFFGAADKLAEVLAAAEPGIDYVIIQLHLTVLVDTSGLLALEELGAKLVERQQTLLLCSTTPEMLGLLKEAGIPAALGDASVQGDLASAFEWIVEQQAQRRRQDSHD